MADTFDNFPTSYENARQLGCYRAYCTRVVDGDTYDFICDLGLTVRVKVRVRLQGFDTAEIFHPRNDAELQHGLEAKRLLEGWIGSGWCLIRTFRTKSDTDVTTVGRYVADVYYYNGEGQWRDIKLLMHDAGLEKQASY
jgi:endonuclease YncB( thermonuclease family)